MAIIPEEIEITGYIVFGRMLARDEFESFDDLTGYAKQVEANASGETFIFCSAPPEDNYPAYSPCVVGSILTTCEEDEGEEAYEISPSTWSARPDREKVWKNLEASGVSFADDGPTWYLCVTGWGWARLSASGSEGSPKLPTADAECGVSAEPITPEMLAFLRENAVTMTVSYC